MGQVVALCTSDETEDAGYNKTTVEKVRMIGLCSVHHFRVFFQ